MKVLDFLKKKWKYIVVAIIALMIGAAGGPSKDELASANSSVKELKKEVSTHKETISNLESENEDLQAKVDEAAPWFEMQEAERIQKEAEAKAAEEKRLADEKAAEEKRVAEEQAKAEAEAKKAEEEAKKGYETGITYNQLARTPDDYIGEKVKFKGTVIQVIEGDYTTQIRFAVNDDYDTVLFAEYDKSIVSSRILEDDFITIMGTSAGLITYESTMGGNISIPAVSIDKIDQ